MDLPKERSVLYMSTEIKIVDSPINQSVSTLKGSAATFESDFQSEIKGEKELELLEKFNHINQNYASLIQTYQALMLNHLESTKSSVQSINNLDSSLVNTISYHKSFIIKNLAKGGVE